METRKATIIGPDGPVHIKVVDERKKPHWFLPAHFDPGAPRSAGARVIIEHRPQDGGWFVKKQKP